MDQLIFLGSGGARVVVFHQVRASGGIWMALAGVNLIIDPGPGSLVRICSSRHKLNPQKLDAVLLSHRHLDHSADVNVLIEAMTESGLKRRGWLFAPQDALEGDPVVFRYLRGFLDEVVLLRAGGRYRIRELEFSSPVRHLHRGETYGFLFAIKGFRIAYIADTKYFPELAEHYKADLVIFNVVRLEPSELDHLSVPDVKQLLLDIRPRIGIITHFGMGLIRAHPWEIAERLSQETGVKVVAARDGMRLSLDELYGPGSAAI
jgi:phosphoribosyl 1,2-cyclic phosphodiesterase